MQELLEARLRATVFHILSKQRYLKKLPNHGYQAFVAFAMFTATSWIFYYLIAPALILYSRKKKLKDDDHARAKWGHMAASFLHAIIACGWTLYLWYDNTLAHTLQDRVFGYSSDYGSMFAFSAGYFLWDVFCCAWHIRHYGKGFFIHSLLGLGGVLCCYRPFMMYPTSRFLLFEFSTIFVDMHWFLEKLGHGGGRLILINDFFGLLAYIGFRLTFGSYLTYRFLKDLSRMYTLVPLPLTLGSLLANLTTHVLNFYWFYKLGRSLLRRCLVKEKTSSIKKRK